MTSPLHLAILDELEAEYLRLGSAVCNHLQDETPLSAFIMLGLQCTSLLKLVPFLIEPSVALVACGVVERAFLEACQLQSEFRFFDSKKKIADWFKNKGESWKSDKSKLNAFMQAQKGTGFGREYGDFSAVAHPTVLACRHAVAIVTGAIGLHRNPQQLPDAVEMRLRNYENLVFRELWNAFYKGPQLMEIPIERANLLMCIKFLQDVVKIKEQQGRTVRGLQL